LFTYVSFRSRLSRNQGSGKLRGWPKLDHSVFADSHSDILQNLRMRKGCRSGSRRCSVTGCTMRKQLEPISKIGHRGFPGFSVWTAGSGGPRGGGEKYRFRPNASRGRNDEMKR